MLVFVSKILRSALCALLTQYSDFRNPKFGGCLPLWGEVAILDIGCMILDAGSCVKTLHGVYPAKSGVLGTILFACLGHSINTGFILNYNYDWLK